MAVATRTRISKSSKETSKKSTRRTRGGYVIWWITTHLVHTKAEWIGKPFVLLDWQKEFIRALFEVGEDNLRIKRWALLGIAKKNGKTELAAALALYFLIGDEEPAPLVVVAASSEDQADYVFGACATMCRMSPTLSQITEIYNGEIRVPSIPGSLLKRVAAAVGTNDGANIHAVVCDELHEWVGVKGKGVWDVLTNGTGSRRQPMVLQITTAGFDLDTVCGRQYLHGKAVEAGEEKDPGFLFRWTEAPANANWKDPAVWEAANPSWGRTLPTPGIFYADQAKRKTEAVFRRYFLNQWTEAEEIWEVASLWDGLKSDLELSTSRPLYCGIDIGTTHDCTAVVWCQKVEGKYVVRCKVWENPYPFGTRMHDEWRFEIALAKDFCRDLFAEFPEAATKTEKGVWLSGPAFYFDPARFVDAAQELAADGLNMVEVPQHESRLIPISQAFFEFAKEGILAHDGNPDLRRHIRNVVAKQKPRGWRIDKPAGSRKNIDAAMAAATAVFGASRNDQGPPTPGVYGFDLDDLDLSEDQVPGPDDQPD